MSDNDQQVPTIDNDPKKELQESMAQYYGSSVDYKDSITSAELNRFLLFYAGLFAEFVPHDGMVLDLGCGAGTSTQELKSQGYQVVGLDISHLFLSTASKRPDAPDYVCASAEDIPYRDNTFDAVGANSFIEHVPDVEQVLSEMYRVTKPGGKLIFHGPNLLSPLVPLVKAARVLMGQKISPVYGDGFLSCIATSLRNARLLRQKKKSGQADIIYREPLLDDEEFTADDADATWYANRHDLTKLLTDLGCRIVVSHKEFPGVRSAIAQMFPDALGLTIVAEK